MRRVFVAGLTVLLVVLMQETRGAMADPIHDLMIRLFQSEPLIPDGSVSPNDPLPFGHTVHVVTHDNQDTWKVQVSPTGAVTFQNDSTCDSANTPLPPGALHLVVAPGA